MKLNRVLVAAWLALSSCTDATPGGEQTTPGAMPSSQGTAPDAGLEATEQPEQTNPRTDAGPGWEPGLWQQEAGAPEAVAEKQAALLSLRTCGEVDQAVRSAASRALEQLLEEQRKLAKERLAASNCAAGGFPGFADAGALIGGALNGFAGGIGGLAGTIGGVAAAPPSDVSETNNQVSGVDEPDLVKNDDRFIYLVAQGALQIVQAWPPAEAKRVAHLALDATPKRLLLHGDRLLLFSSVPKTSAELARYQPWARAPAGDCTYGYDCDFTGDGSGTRISVFDVADRGAPRLLRTIESDATFLSARGIGSSVHVVLYEEPELLKTLRINPLEIEQNGVCTGGASGTSKRPAPGDADRLERLFDALRAENLAAIERATPEQLRSKLADNVVGAPAGEPREPCSGFYESPRPDGTAFLSLLSFDLENTSAVQTSTIVSRPGASYASADAYYIMVRQQQAGPFWFAGLSAADEASTIHKFDLAGSSNRYAASGVVKGRVLNQFSADEYEGHLRIATTSGHLPNPDVHSTLSVLAQRETALTLVGQVDGIGKTEDIRSVRFVGERGYLVTFKKTDPLFVFDLAEPSQPRLLGELFIPGFSTYMHPLDESHLLTIGYDADDQGDFAWFRGLMLQIFDVSDPLAPALAQKLVIGTRGTSSEAATNHLAFNYFAPRETLAVPITVCEGGTGSETGTMTFSGVQLYRVSVSEGFSLRGDVDHPYVDPYGSSGYGVGSACTSWWTQARSVVKRSVFMDDFVYSISDLRLKVADLRDLSRNLADVSLLAP